MRVTIAMACLTLGCSALGACSNDQASTGAGDKTSSSTSPPVPAPTSTAPTTAAAATASASARAPFSWERGSPPADKWGDKTAWEGTLEEQNELLLAQLQHYHGLDDKQMQAVRRVFVESDRLSQGNPDVSRHPVSPGECRRALKQRGETYDDDEWARICGARYMAPLYDPSRDTAKRARACVDRFEFPNIPCVYPVTWVRASEAAALCEAMGKRLCDAHEWEGACLGGLEPPDYDFSLFERMTEEDARKIMRARHNGRIDKERRWAYGPEYKKGVCGTGSNKSKKCGVGWRRCGTNTYPAGFFAGCKSALGVYDQHGNAAEHMNIPFGDKQLSTDPSKQYGHTEMKGSWFVFDTIHAHDDHCRWRAPYWHGTRVTSPGSHRNYHLGFRCCKTPVGASKVAN